MSERESVRLTDWSGSRRAFCTLLPGMAVLALAGANQAASAQAAKPPAAKPPAKPPTPKAPPGIPRVTMVVENRGTIVIEMLPHEAPRTVAHFLALVNKKFYDRILFHGVVAGFMAQAGDPASKKLDGAKLRGLTLPQVTDKYSLGTGGSGQTVPLEPTIPHERGTVGLFHHSNIDSGDSEFFFNLADNHSMDSAYCVFGKIVQGLEVMDKIRQGDRILTMRQVGVSAAPPKPKK